MGRLNDQEIMALSPSSTLVGWVRVVCGRVWCGGGGCGVVVNSTQAM